MADKKYIMVSMDDEKAKNIAEILGNKTCKKILDFLSETKEASEKDIADALNLPINTVEYNLKKLIDSGLIEKTKNFFWSKKGKKIIMYKISNKSIIISPKSKIESKIKSVLPVAVISLISALIIRELIKAQITFADYSSKGADMVAQEASKFIEPAAQAAQTGTTVNIFTTLQPFPVWGWFLAGAIFALLLYILINWRKI